MDRLLNCFSICCTYRPIRVGSDYGILLAGCIKMTNLNLSLYCQSRELFFGSNLAATKVHFDKNISAKK